MSRYFYKSLGKYYVDYISDYPAADGWEQPFIPRRFVSQDELDRVGVGKVYVVSNGSHRFDYCIFEPGYYRVKKTAPRDTYFQAPYADGFCESWNSGFVKEWFSSSERKRLAGRRVHDEKVLSRLYLNRRKTAALQSRTDAQAGKFFQTLGLISVVQKFNEREAND